MPEAKIASFAPDIVAAQLPFSVVDDAAALAIEQAEAALGIDPESADANTAIGVALFLLGDTDAAAIRYEQALSIDPTSSRARRHQGANLLFGVSPRKRARFSLPTCGSIHAICSALQIGCSSH